MRSVDFSAFGILILCEDLLTDLNVLMEHTVVHDKRCSSVFDCSSG